MIIIPDKRAMLIPAEPKYLPVVKEIEPHAKLTYNSKKYFVARLDCSSSMVAASHGHSHMGPIRHYYNWPGRYTPFDHQLHTADFLCQNPRAYCFNGLRTGKTLSCLWAADYLIAQGIIRKVMVITTLTTLDRVWAHELFVTMPHLSHAVLHGTREKRYKLLAEDHDFYIINHDGAKLITEKFERSNTTFYRMIPELQARDDIDLIIVDEGAVCRNKQTDLWGSLNAICGPDTGRSLWWLTGNPVPAAPTDAWAQAKIVNPKTVPPYFGRFRRQVMHEAGPFKWVENHGWEDIIYEVLQPSIRYKRSDCTSMPKASVDDVVVPMSKTQQKAYDEMFRKNVIEYAEGKITAANEGVKTNKLVQVACGLVYSPDGSLDLEAGPKYKKLVELIEDADSKAIVLLPYRDMVGMLAAKLRKSGYSAAVIQGGVGRTARNKIYQEFQEGFLNVICAHPMTMAHGIDLTNGHTIIWWGPTSYELYEQANARIDGPKQVAAQQIWHLICSKIEQRAYDRLRKHESTTGILLDLLGEKK